MLASSDNRLNKRNERSSRFEALNHSFRHAVRLSFVLPVGAATINKTRER
ncbi:hypothetical protein NPIL_653591, partial [Nephila pilipes]